MPPRLAHPSWAAPVLAVAAVLVLAAAATGGLVLDRAHRHASIGKLKALVHGAEAAHPDVLWRVVHDLCVKDRVSVGSPAPCDQVDLERGFAIIKDPERSSQLLLVPTNRIVGIEAPSLTEPDAENYWRDAWSAKPLFERRLGRPIQREDLGLAVNSVLSRTQDQLHIHIDCVRPELKALLAASPPRSRRWRPLGDRVSGFTYEAMWLNGPDLGAADPFKILSRDARARADMGSYSLALVGAHQADGRPGFVLLRQRETAANDGRPAGEAVLDHHCRVLEGELGRTSGPAIGPPAAPKM